MNTQTVEFKIGLGINSYCAIHSEQDVEVQVNQREGGLVDCVIQPCPQCLADAEAFGRANQKRDDDKREELTKVVCECEVDSLLSEEDQHGARCGDYGQWDDTFDAGVEHGTAAMAVKVLALINNGMLP